MALVLWRLGRFDPAELVLLNMLWLNPMDNQGARALLAPVRERRAWESADERRTGVPAEPTAPAVQPRQTGPRSHRSR
jgi:hypothetical protein